MINQEANLRASVAAVSDNTEIHEHLLQIQNLLWDEVCCPITLSGPGIITTATHAVLTEGYLVEFNVVCKLAGLDKVLNVLGVKCVTIQENVSVYPVELVCYDYPDNKVIYSIPGAMALRSMLKVYMPEIINKTMFSVLEAYQPLMGAGVYEKLLGKFQKKTG